MKKIIYFIGVFAVMSGLNTVQSFAMTVKKSESDTANALFADIFAKEVSRRPLMQTALGRKTNMDKWNDLSEAFSEQSHVLDKTHLQKLHALDRAKLDQSTQLSYDLMEQSLENSIKDYRWRLYNYPVNQMFGVHTDVVSVLLNQHQIDDLSDAQAYITRLDNLPAYFSQLIDSLERRAQAKIIAPKFVFSHVIRDSENIISGAPLKGEGENAIYADFSAKLQKTNTIDEQQKKVLLAQVKTALLKSVQPAYTGLIEYLTKLGKKAGKLDGVWRLKEGAKFYEVALQRTTTTALTATQIHEVGLQEVKRIHGDMREIMKKVKFTGSLREFMVFMRDDPQFYYSADDAGRKRYIDEATALINTMKTHLTSLFVTLPKADLVVKRVEPFREQSAGKAFYSRPSEDGSRPGIYYANLYDMKSMPIYQMEALAYHEGIPGHHMQLSISQELKDIPLFRKFNGYTAYSEGWGLYSEYLPKEVGMYSDPYSDFGRLSMELWRACRLVVDTGIHDKKWTREQGIGYYVNNTPNAISDAVKMVERHIVMPSQATAYKIGMLKILSLRRMAKQKLGDKFEIRQFHEQILQYGPLPLDIVQEKVEAWVDDVLKS